MREDIDIINGFAVLTHLFINRGDGPSSFPVLSMILAILIYVFTLMFVFFLIKDIRKGVKLNKSLLFCVAFNVVYIVYSTF